MKLIVVMTDAAQNDIWIGLSVRVPGCQKLRLTLNPIWYSMFYAVPMATVGVKGFAKVSSALGQNDFYQTATEDSMVTSKGRRIRRLGRGTGRCRRSRRPRASPCSRRDTRACWRTPTSASHSRSRRQRWRTRSASWSEHEYTVFSRGRRDVARRHVRRLNWSCTRHWPREN